jgi:predicted transcriptional regulator of viral defense system
MAFLASEHEGGCSGSTAWPSRVHYAVKCLQISMSVVKTPRADKAASRVLRLAGAQSVLRARDVAAQGVHTSTLTRLTRSGALEKVGPGRYRLPKKQPRTEQHDLVVAASTVPRSVVCLLSALRFHDVGTQLPPEVWIAVPRGARVPRLMTPPLHVVNVSPAVFDLGIEDHRIDRQVVRVYSLARTVADCFRFRNQIGLDVALEALTDAWRSKRLNVDELNRIAKKLRVHRVMQPYLEAVVL